MQGILSFPLHFSRNSRTIMFETSNANNCNTKNKNALKIKVSIIIVNACKPFYYSYYDISNFKNHIQMFE